MFDFKKELQAQINNQLRPILKESGFKMGRKNMFLRETGGLIQYIELYFKRIELLFSAGVTPMYDPFNGSGSYDGIPLKTYETEVAKRAQKYHPSEYINSDDCLLLYRGDPATVQICRENAMERFGWMKDFFIEELMPVFYDIDTLDKYAGQMESNLLGRRPSGLRGEEMVGAYIRGVYSCLNNRFDEGLKMLQVAYNHSAQEIKELKSRLKNYDENNIMDNDRSGRFYRFVKIFIKALETDSPNKERCFQIAYNTVCEEMRVWHRLVKPNKK